MQVFIGSEALATGLLSPYELRTHHTRVLPDVYVPKRTQLLLRDRIEAAWLWSRRTSVIAGLAASALHQAKWVDEQVAIELIHPNCKSPVGVTPDSTPCMTAKSRRWPAYE
jgi:hypothetical protein